MVNGAGLAMATMTSSSSYGSELGPTSMDVGGGATKEKVTQAFKIIVQRSQCEGHSVNIFVGHHEMRHHR